MKNIYIAIAIALLAFYACSPEGSGGGGSGGACYLTFTLMADFGDMCYESADLTSSDCRELAADMDGYTGKFMNSCPSGQDYICEVDGERAYLYGSFFDKNTCRDYFGVDPVKSSSSTGSTKSSSSAGSTKSSSSGNTTTSGACYLYDDDGYAICYKPSTSAECREEGYDWDHFEFRDSCPSGYCDNFEDDGEDVYLYGEACYDEPDLSEYCRVFSELCDEGEDYYCDLYDYYCGGGYGLKAKGLLKAKRLLKAKILR